MVFMFQQLRHIGANVTPDHLVCTPCSQLQAGGFMPASGGISLCQGKFLHKKHMESTIVHELVHMYDQCKFSVDWDNLRHHACSEVRALFPRIRDTLFTRQIDPGQQFERRLQVVSRILRQIPNGLFQAASGGSALSGARISPTLTMRCRPVSVDGQSNPSWPILGVPMPLLRSAPSTRFGRAASTTPGRSTR